jgi:putative transcription factor
MHHHQDFKEIVLGKSTRPQRSGGGFQRSVESKLDNENEACRVNTVGKTVGRKIQNARQAMNIKTRNDLAARINVRPSVIAEYENGVAVPDAKIMQKLRAVLNTKL